VFQVLVLGSWVSRTGSKKIGLMETAKPNKIDLVFIKELLEADKIVPVIDRTYPLSEVPEALRYLEKGHAKGKDVIRWNRITKLDCKSLCDMKFGVI
jgi:NADPH:quinone reductase-like Zn-dependent oxidoreductase